MTLLIGGRYYEALSPALEAYGADVFWLPENHDIDPRLAGHADLSVFVSDGQAVAAWAVYPYIVNYLTNFSFTEVKQSSLISWC